MEKNKLNILLVGGAGYIGTRLCEHLSVYNNVEVDVVDLCWFGSYIDNLSNVSLIRRSLFSLTAADLEKYDCVVYLAGFSSDPMADFSPALNFMHNVGGPTYLGYISKKAKVKKYIFASSMSVYGFCDNREKTELDIPNPTFPYGLSKLQAEKSLELIADNSFKVVCLRKATVNGYSKRFRKDLVINSMFIDAVSQNKITVSNKKIYRPFISIDDIVNLYYQLIMNNLNDIPFEIFNVAFKTYSLYDIAKQIRDSLNLDIQIIDKNISDVRSYRISSEKLYKVYGFQPLNAINDICQTLKGKINKELSITIKNDANTSNVKIFQQMLESSSPLLFNLL